MKGLLITWGPKLVEMVEFPSNSLETISKDLVIKHSIQVSVHDITSATFTNELKIIFPDIPWKHGEITIINTMQNSKMELVRYDTEVDQEKDRLLESVRSCSFQLSYILRA